MSKGMKAALEEEEKNIGDIKKQFVSKSPNRQQHRRFSANQASGGIALSYHRGKQAGREEILKAIKKKFPRVYKYLGGE